jgi:hypothetical protein
MWASIWVIRELGSHLSIFDFMLQAGYDTTQAPLGRVAFYLEVDSRLCVNTEEVSKIISEKCSNDRLDLLIEQIYIDKGGDFPTI